MRPFLRRFALVAFGIFAGTSVRAQAQTPKQNPSPVIQAGTSYHSDLSPPLREIAQTWPPAQKRQERATALDLEINNNHGDAPDPVIPNGFRQRFVEPSIPSPILNFDGMRFGAGGSSVPPDTNGAVGMTQYVQTVNEAFQVFDKTTGVSVLGPLNISLLWSGFGGVCQTSGNGDPVALYDRLANRWLISQFAGTSTPTDACIAVSTTSNATGTWNRYAFHLGSNFFDDPHLGIWPDGYYMSVNVFNSGGTAFLGPQAFAFDRAAMVAGAPATFLTPGITGGAGEPSFLPGDIDGATTPPAGTGNPFVSFPVVGTYRVRLFHADFATPGNTTFALLGSPPAAGYIALCPATIACVPQPGTTVQLDGLGRRLMPRLAYRNFSGHDSLVGNYAVSANGVAGIRWFELRNVTNGPVTVYQESTYQPDTTWRWTGSAAMDQAGNLALGFSASSSTVYPSIRYTGRLVSDPLNTLPQGEATLIAGGGSQTGASGWGRSSSMSVDPVDDCTFWYTNEYYETTSAGNWRTRIGNFRFPECAAAPTPTPTITATPTATVTPTATATATPTATTCGLITYFGESFDGVTAPTLPPGWVSSFTPGPANCTPTGTCALGTNWATSTTAPDTPPNCVFHNAPGCVTDSTLDTPSFVGGGTNGTFLSFRQSYDLENGLDGAVLEISINGGPFVDFVAAGGGILGYNGTISSGFFSPIAGRSAWTGNSGGYVQTFAHMPLSALGQNVRLRFRLATDCNGSGTGWRIDTITVADNIGCPTPTIPPPPPSPTPTATAPPPVNGKIAFVSNRDGNSEIYVMDANGANQTNLTNNLAYDADPVWSFDGTKIAFTSDRDGNRDLYVMDANGSNQIRLTNNPALDMAPAWSPDGTKIAFRSSRDSQFDIYVMDANGSNPIRLTNGPIDNGAPAWSPDGTKIAFASLRGNDHEIYVMDANGANQANLTNHLAEDLEPRWSPDGTKIAFTSTRDNNDHEVYVINANGSNPTRLTFPPAYLNRYPTWSPDGTKIAFTSDRDDNFEIYVMNADGSNPVRLTNQSERDGNPSWGIAASVTPSPTPTPTPTPTPSPLIVTNTNDSGPGSLRQVLADAHDGDNVQFAPALNGQTIFLTSGELSLSNSITITGPGPNLLTVSRSAQAEAFRIFHVQAGHVVIIQGLTISGGFDYGGGILNGDASLSIISCIIRDNVSPGSGGGIFNSASSANATLTILDSTITGNRCVFGGGGIYNQAFEFVGTELTLTDSVVSYNQALDPMSGSGFGGGIYSLSGSRVTLNNCTVSHNAAGTMGPPAPGGHGGGIGINGATLTITNSTINDNQSGSTGGGLENGFGSLVITNSSLIGNQAFGTSDNGPLGRGGGVFNSGWLTITNGTLSDNYAGVSGGGIFNAFGNGSETLTITNSTLSSNRADQSGGGITNFVALEIRDTILKAGTAGANILNNGGTVTSHGYNLSSDDGGGFLTAAGDQTNTDPILGPLQDNGGPTFTHALLLGSPAIDTGDPNFTPPPLTDQRGYLRVYNGRIDIGSFEVQPGPTPTPTSTPTPTPARPLNLSTRVQIQTGDRVGIGGFIITGSTPKQVLLRAIGPSLAGAGVPNPLADPVMELHGPAAFTTITNDNWRETQEAAIIATGIPPTNDLESAILVILDPGAYTAIVKGKNDTSGVGLVEVYDLDQVANSLLANISTRAFVGTGADVTIGGFILGGGSDTHILIRGIGPSLAGSGIIGALADPTLELRDSNGALLASNDNCGVSPSIPPTNPLEACIDISLPPGAFTAILAGKNGGTGIGLVEIYNLQ